MTHNGYNDSNGEWVKRVDIVDYPAIKEHLDTYSKELQKRLDQGDTPYNLRSCAYMDDFNKQKIVFPAIMSGGAFFAHEEEGFMVVAPGNIITGKNITALGSFLPSNLCYYALRTFYMGGGIEGELKVNRLLLLPIPLNIDNREYTEKEIYSIYGLSDEEIKFISSSLNSNDE